MTTKPTNKQIVAAALAARTPSDSSNVQALIESAVGARYVRPVGDRYNNQGMLTGSGSSYDHKILEVVTNMQDSVLERYARAKFGSMSAVPYEHPHAAAADLFAGLAEKSLAGLATVTIDPSGTGRGKKQVTILMRDLGCGITCAEIPMTIFQIGARNKNGIAWQQGKFGLGGATTYRNAQSVVLVSRRAPELLAPGEEDRIAIAVVQWEREYTTINAFYLVTSPWSRPGDIAVPFSVPAVDFPTFEPGVHLALIAYDTEALARRSGDEKSFDTVFNTRIYRPVVPVTYRNNLVRDRDEVLKGLERRLDDNPAEPGFDGRHALPFKHEGITYHLPVRFRLFSKSGEKGARRNFVAQGHALALTSNGQVHAHWNTQEFKLRTKLNKLADRVFVVVESDALPIELRTELFTADRAQLVKSAVAMRLESEIASFLDDWAALQDANVALIKEAITGDNNGRPTLEIARKIARALKMKGFSIGAVGTKGGGKAPAPTPPEDLYVDPTHFEGPEHVEAVVGRTKGVYFRLNAKDDFLGEHGRAELQVTCDHPEIGADDITIGELRAGRVRVSIAVADTEDVGTYKLQATIAPWPKASGGLGQRLDWTTKLELVTETTPHPTGPRGAGPKKGSHGPGEGDLVALIWRTDEDEDGWTPATVGEILMVSGKDLAEKRDEYKELATIIEDIPTIVLNRTYSPLKSYVQARAAEVTEEFKEQARERYAVGVGVALLVLEEQRRANAKKGIVPDEAASRVAAQAAARGVLSVLPDFDRLAKEMMD